MEKRKILKWTSAGKGPYWFWGKTVRHNQTFGHFLAAENRCDSSRFREHCSNTRPNFIETNEWWRWHRTFLLFLLIFSSSHMLWFEAQCNVPNVLQASEQWCITEFPLKKVVVILVFPKFHDCVHEQNNEIVYNLIWLLLLPGCKFCFSSLFSQSEVCPTLDILFLEKASGGKS